MLAAGGGLFDLFLNLLFMLIALFFIYKDGERFVGQVDRIGERILPTRWGRISRVVPATISSTVTGMTLIAIGEGIVLGIAYWIAGAPSPVTLGVITGVMALIPGGAPLSFTPGLDLPDRQRLAHCRHRAVDLGLGRALHRRQDAAAQARRRPDQAAFPADLLRPRSAA